LGDGGLDDVEGRSGGEDGGEEGGGSGSIHCDDCIMPRRQGGNTAGRRRLISSTQEPSC
jgi:hypothetical protein